MLVNQDYQYPSQLHDSSADYSADNPSIKAVNLYQLDASISESEDQHPPMLRHGQELEIIHSLDQSSIEHDDFLEMVKQEEKAATNSTFPTKSTVSSGGNFLLVDKAQVSLTLLETQKTREVLAFTNPTANPIRMRFGDCPFLVQNDKMLGFLVAEQLEVIIEPWGRVELTFAIEPQAENYGDIIQTVVVMGEFVGREERIFPLSIKFHVHYVSPKLTIKYEGSTDVTTFMQGSMAVMNIKPNKLGEYSLQIAVDGIHKMQLQVQARGKATTSTDSVTVYSGQTTKIKLRQRGSRNSKSKERSGLILKPVNSQMCYVMGLYFLS